MKLIALAAALAMAGTAAAQDMGTTSAPTAPQSTTTATPTDDPVGGYQPANPPMSAPPAPGATVVFQQAPAPDVAFPAPAPLAEYPICKKGQYDNCRQRGG
ncbi:hypothetical protein [Sphingomonas sp.]|jgi:hypothetical protein|uniref:hypothetical protein n=1 Tax=Sphingomonas sp. TaxID=28214 RepID=UPI003BA94631